MRPEERSLTLSTLAQLRSDLDVIVRSALAAADAGLLVGRAAVDLHLPADSSCDVLAIGKAAGPMITSWLACASGQTRTAVAITPKSAAAPPRSVEWVRAGHPVPDEGSLAAGARALRVAREVPDHGVLVVLLSGGASALMCAPVEDVMLEDTQQTSRKLMERGADIDALNCVRKHLSRVKGGWLAAGCSGATVALAVSDVVGDSPNVIGSGPTVPDPTRFADALAILDRFGGRDSYPTPARAYLERGAGGRAPETPKPGDPRLARSTFRLIGSGRDALEGARDAAEKRGYRTRVLDEPIVGDAAVAGASHLERIAAAVAGQPRPCCVVSAGETTVRVMGHGIGGRNQEFALALGRSLSGTAVPIAVASVGTDGVDGPTDAAGAVVDSRTIERARVAGLPDPDHYLDNNDSYRFFEAVGDLVRTGPTHTNVGDLQVALIGG